MKEYTLITVIEHFDQIVKNVDFAHLPISTSDEYYQLLLKTANDEIFAEGRYSRLTEWTLELFDLEEFEEKMADLSVIDALTDEQRTRLLFYYDLKKICYPLFKGEAAFYNVSPWRMSESRNSLLDNEDLYNFIEECRYPALSAAILYSLKEQIWSCPLSYSPTAIQEASDSFEHNVAELWKHQSESEEKVKALSAGVNKCVNDLWMIENHMRIGRMLGFSSLSQAVYDAADTFIDTTYRYNQVEFAKEMDSWIFQFMKLGERHLPDEKREELLAKLQELMAKHHVTSPNFRLTCSILCHDVLGMSMFPKEEPEINWDDDSIWDEGRLE